MLLLRGYFRFPYFADMSYTSVEPSLHGIRVFFV